MEQTYMMEQRYVAEEQRMLPCRLFINGFCVQGGRCPFYHPPAAQLPTSIHCPPLPAGFGIQLPRGGCTTPSSRYGSSPTFDYLPTTRPTQCYFGQEPDVTMRSVSETSFDSSRDYNLNEVGQEGDARVTPLPNGVTSTYQNGLVSYDYPNQVEGTEVHYRERDSEGTTMFTHINWNEFLLPGVSAPPVVNVPLEDLERPQRGRGFLDRTKPPQQFETAAAENLDTPPEGSVEKKLTPREEFQLKIKRSAFEGVEPVPPVPVRSVDSYFNTSKTLDNLPRPLFERKKKLSAPNENTTETKYPPIPELEEGELLGSDESLDEHPNENEE